ncbi:MAG TPA: GPP34 family phosphoprotein [Micromonosporaceae bacterium]
MNISALLERPVTKYRRIFPSTDPRDPQVRLPLRTELFLIAHDDQTGRAHIDQHSLSLGLAGAVLLELWLTMRILIGRAYLVRDGVYTPDPGRITITDPTPYGDPLTDAAMNLLKRTGGQTYVSDFIREFATLDLYDRVRGDMLAIGVLHRVTRHRLNLFRRETYLPVTTAYSVQVRTWLRNLATPRDHTQPLTDLPDMQTVALAGLVTALGLTRHLYHADPGALHRRLMDIITRLYDNTIRDVHAAINPSQRRTH